MKHRSPPKAVVFDFGGTIVAGNGFDDIRGNRRLLELCTSNPHDADEYRIKEEALRIDAELMMPLRDNNLDFSIQLFQHLLYDGLQMKFSVDPQEMELEFWKSATDYRPMPDAATMLDSLRRMGISIGMLSNNAFSSETIRRELARHGLDVYFSFIVASSEYGICKPAKRIFDIAVAKTGCARADVWYAGDIFAVDISGAHAAGLTPVWYNPQDKTPDADIGHISVRSWREFIGIVCDEH
ncbi:MAG: HAD family hydrolase [Spirochaetes bacterium]|nr:HAD family hydrolase [Spirochaetota bacterium]